MNIFFQLLKLLTTILFVNCQQRQRQSRNLLQQFSVNSGSCQIELGTHVDGIPVDDELRSSRGFSHCCSMCEEHPSCNVFTYCSRRSGCQDEGINIEVVDYGTCTLKYQQQVADGESPLFLREGFQTDFGSGYITGKQTQALPTVNGSADTLQRNFASQLQSNYVLEECTDYAPAQDMTCQQSLLDGKCNEVWMVLNGYCEHTCGRCSTLHQSSNCTFIPNFYAKGTLVDSTLRFAKDLLQCCRMCGDNPGCNTFVYCGNQRGCANEGQVGRVMNFTRCELKYQEVVAKGLNPEAWFQGPDVDFTSGYILNKLSTTPNTMENMNIESSTITIRPLFFSPDPSPSSTPLPPPTPATNPTNTPTPTPTPQIAQDGSSDVTLVQREFNPSLLATKSGQCSIQFQHRISVQIEPFVVASTLNCGECCRLCSENVQCNLFSFCNSRNGCQFGSNQIQYKVCELMYDQEVESGESPQNWILGSGNVESNGFIAGYVINRAF